MLPSVDIDEIKSVYANANCLHSLDDINLALDKMAKEVTERLAETNPLLICVMSGGLMPMGALLSRLDFPLQIDFLHVSRYQEALSGGQLDWRVSPKRSLKNRTVLLVDDVLDGGITLAEIIKFCQVENAQEVYTAVLVDKIRERSPESVQQADFTGLNAEDLYLFGYGMDYKGYLRNAPGIFAVSE